MEQFLQICMPAGLCFNVLTLIFLGLVAGVVGGMLGLGGGLIIIPFFITQGLPASMAISIGTSVMIGSSFSSYLAYHAQQRVDYRLGGVMLLGGLSGVMIGSTIFNTLKDAGDVMMVTSFAFILLLLFISLSSIKDLLIVFGVLSPKVNRSGNYKIAQLLPLQIKFNSSSSKISIILVISVGVLAGMVVSIFGIGGGIIIVPILVYLLNVNPKFAPGTSHFQMFFSSGLSTVLHILHHDRIDILSAAFVILGATFGGQIGARLNARVRDDVFRVCFAIVVVIISYRLISSLVVEPYNVYSFQRLV